MLRPERSAAKTLNLLPFLWCQRWLSRFFFDNPETDPSLRIKVKGLIQWDISDGRSESALSWSSPPGCHARYANVSGLGIEL